MQARRKRAPPHFLADQLTLSQARGAHYPHPVLCAPPDFQTLRRPCMYILLKIVFKTGFEDALLRIFTITNYRQSSSLTDLS